MLGVRGHGAHVPIAQQLDDVRCGGPGCDGCGAPPRRREFGWGTGEHRRRSRWTKGSPPVLTLTDNAATEIRNLTADPELPEGCGMRIANDPASNALTLTLVPTPAAGDQVLEEDGARVFLDQQAAALLDDRALDAAPDNAGQVKFTIADTPHS